VNWIGLDVNFIYNLGSYWIFLLWIMDVHPFPRIVVSQYVILYLGFFFQVLSPPKNLFTWVSHPFFLLNILIRGSPACSRKIFMWIE
jgi:hypothetical protein